MRGLASVRAVSKQAREFGGGFWRFHLRFLSFWTVALLLSTPAHSEVPAVNTDQNYSSSAQLTRSALDDDDQLVSVSLDGGSELKLISPQKWAPLISGVVEPVTNIHRDFERTFGRLPPFKASVRLTDSEDFFRSTGAPTWTTAVYYRGEILIPIRSSEEVDLKTLRRSIRHEYTHALIHALSDGKCPGWLDEGLAQWAEDESNTIAQSSIPRLLIEHQPLRLELLQEGFTKLDYELASVAYAESLFAAKQVITTFGFERIRVFFDGLRQGLRKGTAFERAFSTSEDEFEQKLGRALLVERHSTLRPQSANS